VLSAVRPIADGVAKSAHSFLLRRFTLTALHWDLL